MSLPTRSASHSTAGAIGEVVATTVDTIAEGDVVRHGRGWRDYAVVDAASATVLDTGAAPVNAYLGVLGMTGLTAWAGLLVVAGLTAGDVVRVSAASGAAGQIAGQLAKIHGTTRVIGSAGSAAKVRRLADDFGFDAAFDYHDGDITQLLQDAAPDGIDAYFDNVGGDHLAAAIAAANIRARFVPCGAIAGYNATDRPVAPRNLNLVIGAPATPRNARQRPLRTATAVRRGRRPARPRRHPALRRDRVRRTGERARRVSRDAAR
jgi:NADPH-dependent curcumin reductase CurA